MSKAETREINLLAIKRNVAGFAFNKYGRHFKRLAEAVLVACATLDREAFASSPSVAGSGTTMKGGVGVKGAGPPLPEHERLSILWQAEAPREDLDPHQVRLAEFLTQTIGASQCSLSTLVATACEVMGEWHKCVEHVSV